MSDEVKAVVVGRKRKGSDTSQTSNQDKNQKLIRRQSSSPVFFRALRIDRGVLSSASAAMAHHITTQTRGGTQTVPGVSGLLSLRTRHPVRYHMHSTAAAMPHTGGGGGKKQTHACRPAHARTCGMGFGSHEKRDGPLTDAAAAWEAPAGRWSVERSSGLLLALARVDGEAVDVEEGADVVDDAQRVVGVHGGDGQQVAPERRAVVQRLQPGRAHAAQTTTSQTVDLSARVAGDRTLLSTESDQAAVGL